MGFIIENILHFPRQDNIYFFYTKYFTFFKTNVFFFLLTNRQWEAGNGSQKDDGEQTAAKLFNMMITLALAEDNPLVEKTVQDYFLFHHFLSRLVFSIQILMKDFLWRYQRNNFFNTYFQITI